MCSSDLYWGIYKKTKSGGLVVTGKPLYTTEIGTRSEERRVGKECW